MRDLKLPHEEPGPSEAQLGVKDIVKLTETVLHEDHMLAAADGENNGVTF